MQKTCKVTRHGRGCGQLKDFEFFSNSSKSIDGKVGQCKDCNASYAKSWNQRTEVKQHLKDKTKTLEFKEKSKIWQKRSKNKPDVKRKRWNTYLVSNYGITAINYETLLLIQNNTCAICKQPEVEIDFKTKKAKKLAVDHCHETSLVRGSPCQKCNTAIGLLNESLDRLDSAKMYLARFG